jgi:hypothetical protein
MNTDEFLKKFEDVNYHFTFKDLGILFIENLQLRAELLALRKYCVLQFLGLNGVDDLLKIDENKKSELDQEYKVIAEYFDDIFQDLFADFITKYGKVENKKND